MACVCAVTLIVKILHEQHALSWYVGPINTWGDMSE